MELSTTYRAKLNAFRKHYFQFVSVYFIDIILPLRNKTESLQDKKLKQETQNDFVTVEKKTSPKKDKKSFQKTFLSIDFLSARKINFLIFFDKIDNIHLIK